MTPLAATTSAAPTTGSRPTRNAAPDSSFADLFAGASTDAPAGPVARAAERPARQNSQLSADTTVDAAADAAADATATVTADASLPEEEDAVNATGAPAAEESKPVDADAAAGAEPVLTARDPQAALEVNAQLLAGLTPPQQVAVDASTTAGPVEPAGENAPIGSAPTGSASAGNPGPASDVAAAAVPVAVDVPAGATPDASAGPAATSAAAIAPSVAADTQARTQEPASVQAAAEATDTTTAAEPVASVTTSATEQGSSTAASAGSALPGQQQEQSSSQNPSQNSSDTAGDVTATRPALVVADATAATDEQASQGSVDAPAAGPQPTTNTSASPSAAAGAPTLAPARPPLADTAPTRMETMSGTTFVDAGVGIDDPSAAAVITRAVPERDGNTKLVMRLDPPDLGSLAITMRRDGAGLHVQVTADAALTPAQVQQLRESAAQAAEAADTRLADFTASQGNAGDRDNDNQDRGRTIRLAPADHASDERPATPRLTGTGTVVWL